MIKFKPIINIRIDNDLLNEVDKIANGTHIGRNELIVQCDYTFKNRHKEESEN